jgi:hypothetical protein
MVIDARILGGIFSLLVISWRNVVVCDVDVDDFAHLQLITSQLVNLFSIVDVKRNENKELLAQMGKKMLSEYNELQHMKQLVYLFPNKFPFTPIIRLVTE